MGKGFLEIKLFAGDQVLPVANAKVLVKDSQGKLLYELMSDENGLVKTVTLETPDKEASTDPYSTSPRFAVCDVEVPNMEGFKKSIVHDVQIFDGITSILPVQMYPEIIGGTSEENTDEIYIPYEHGVDETRNIGQPGDFDNYNSIHITERILANEVKIPDYFTVHLGMPNATAQNVRVPFIDYIKNVASSEIFPTWEESALYANIYAQISFALNRHYTVWYRSRGFDFDVTNSTAFDQSFVYGRNIFSNISQIVDGIFNMFIRRQGRREPFFASYCNGTTSTCEGLSQWGSQSLALQGYTPIQILRYYYPNDVQIVESNTFTSALGTFPGTPLKEGSSGADVQKMQLYLNRISGNYYVPTIPNPDGYFGTATKAAVVAFQQINNLVADGIIGKSTWYQITKIYFAVTELAELTSEGERIGIGATPPTITIQSGSRGEYVVELQFLLNFISEFFPVVPFVIQNGVFRDDTKRSVVEFQKEFGLTPDGVVGPGTWRKLYDVYHSIQSAVTPTPSTPAFPGTALRVGSRGESVRLMQNYLNAISAVYPSVPSVVADGVFGANTQAAVIAFQRLFNLTPDGVIGALTWDAIISVYNNLSGQTTPAFPGTALRVGSRGSEVQFMQTYLNAISKVFPVIPSLTADGIFGTGTQSSVMAFQRLFGLTPDGVIGRITWDKIVSVYNNLPNVAAPVFPGTSLRVGSRGNDVILMQQYLNSIARQYPSIPTLTADGIFGSATEQAVIAFQRLFGLTQDGVIGRNTWNQIVSIYNLVNMNRASIYSVSSVGEEKAGYNKLAWLLLAGMMRG